MQFHTLDDIEKELYERTLAFHNEHTVTIDSKEDCYKFLTPKKQRKTRDPWWI